MSMRGISGPIPLYNLKIYAGNPGLVSLSSFDFVGKLAVRHQPCLEILDIWVNLLHLFNVGTVSDIVEPPKHVSKVLHRPHDQVADQPVGPGHIPARVLFENLACLFDSKLIPSKRNGAVLIFLGAQEGFRSHNADIRNGYQLKRFLLYSYPPSRGEDAAEKVVGKVLHKSDGPQDGPAHLSILCAFDQVLFDVVLVDKMGNVGRVVDGCAAMAVDGGIDEVLNAGFHGCIDHIPTLGEFGVSLCKANGHLS